MTASLPRTVGILAIGRPTFDLDWARPRIEAAIGLLRDQGVVVVGDTEPLLEPADVAPAISALGSVDRVVVIQATFTDGRFIAALSGVARAQPSIWAFPEYRGGGRLRANSLCGLVLASYTLAESGRALRWLYADPLVPGTGERVGRWLAAPPPAFVPLGPPPSDAQIAPDDLGRAAAVAEMLGHSRVGIVGRPPPGFGPCHLHTRAEALGIEADSIDIAPILQEIAATTGDVAPPALPGVGALDPVAVATSVRLRHRLRDIADERQWDAIGVRCWPEMFDVLGCAACAALAHLNEGGLPAGCEADALGSITMLVLGRLGDSRPFLADLVDIDSTTNTAALWHCGVAPADLAAVGSLSAGNHPNRGVPLVQELRLRPGPATVARISQSRGSLRLVLGRVEIVDEPLPYAGSGGVVRFERPVEDVLETMIAEGLEHHLGLVAGDLSGALIALAAHLGLGIVRL